MPRYFSSQPVYNAPVAAIDRESGVIRGVTVAKVGLAKGHDAWLDRTFLLQIVDQAGTRPQGIKARFGHPNMCSTALGTYLGRFHNYSYAGDKVVADLRLDDTAKNTPNGNLHDYILDMAEKNPDMFGASIAFESSDFEEVEETVDGKKMKLKCFRLKELRATDIVDDPAATDGLFSADTLPAQATRFLDENPEIAELIFSKPQNIIEFLSNYINNSTMSLAEKLKANFAAFVNSFSAAEVSSPSEPAPVHQEAGQEGALEDQATEPSAQLETLNEKLQTQSPEPGTLHLAPISLKLESLKLKLETQSQELETLKADLSAARDQIADLTDRLAARPSIPLNVTDPRVSANLHTEDPDDTGRQILASLPRDLKRKLKSK
jgi:hypothetical protein